MDKRKKQEYVTFGIVVGFFLIVAIIALIFNQQIFRTLLHMQDEETPRSENKPKTIEEKVKIYDYSKKEGKIQQREIEGYLKQAFVIYENAVKKVDELSSDNTDSKDASHFRQKYAQNAQTIVNQNILTISDKVLTRLFLLEEQMYTLLGLYDLIAEESYAVYEKRVRQKLDEYIKYVDFVKEYVREKRPSFEQEFNIMVEEYLMRANSLINIFSSWVELNKERHSKKT